jgi:tetratricopeptide (TPR) repeat protein
MKRITALIMFSFVALTTFAVDVEIEYVDGFLDLKDGNGWLLLAPGDVVSEGDTLRLDEESYATLRYPGGTLTLTRPGVYPVSSLIRSSSAARGMGTLVSTKIKRLVTEPERTRSAVGGVRGSKQEDEITWMESEAEELVTKGKKLLADEEYQSALASFTEAYDYAEIEEEPEILFYTAYANYALGNVREAMKNVESVELPRNAYFAADYYLLRGQLLFDSFAFEEAANWLKSVPKGITEGDRAAFQAVNLLLGACMESLGDKDAAITYYDSVVKADPTSDYAKAAQDAK